MADIPGVICSALSCICSTPTCDLIDQHRNVQDDVDELRTELALLTGRKQDIELQIDVEVDGEQMVMHEVKVWLKEVQKIDDHVQKFLQKVQKNKWYNRSCLDRRVCRKIDKLKKMFERGSFQSIVIETAPAPGLIFQPEKLEGSTKDEIWKYLMDNEVGMIGVCGAGGVGKTAIMKHINDDLVRDGRFQKVIWVVVSYPLDVFELQKKIVDAMSKKKTVDAKGQTLPEDDKDKRAAALTQKMERKRFVLILDDVWENFSLSDVGIPKPTGKNGCKVVITSRSDEVCNNLGCHKIVPVQPLSPEESRNLFLDRVGRDVLDVGGLEEILNSILKECDGLPLAIVLIAGSLRGKYAIEEWRTMLDDLQQCVESVEGMEDKVFARLKLSYDRLKWPEIQQCFLYCSLFQEDYVFSRQGLIEGWIDEGLIDKSRGRQKAYDRGHLFLNRLERNCLLEKTVDWRGFDAFKMHDVVRDMAIRSIGPGVGYMVRSGMKLTEVPNVHDWATNLKKVSLMANHISKIPVGLTPKCPTLSTLILSGNPNLSEIPSSFFEGMVGLKVLDLCNTGIEALPNSISNLVNLSALRLRKCGRLKYLPSLVELRALKKLDLHETGIKVVPQGIEMLVSLEYLDLLCPNLKEIRTGILPNLSSLQFLVVYPSSAITKRFNLEEVARLSKLESLKCGMGGIQDFNYLVNKSKDFKSLTTYDLQLKTSEHDITGYSSGDDKYQRNVLIAECEIGEEHIVLPHKVEDLRIVDCENMKNMRCSLNKIVLLENATELRHCFISESKGIECIVELDSTSSSLCCPVLDKLEELHLRDLPNLSVLVRVEGVAISPRIFSNLTKLKIWECSGMRNLLPLGLLRALQNLEVIHVWRCEQMGEILASSDSDDTSSNNFNFPKLKC